MTFIKIQSLEAFKIRLGLFYKECPLQRNYNEFMNYSALRQAPFNQGRNKNLKMANSSSGQLESYPTDTVLPLTL